MITMLSNSLIEQLNVNRRTCHIAMKVISSESFSPVVWWGARAACAEASTGSVEASKARLGFRPYGSRYIQKIIIINKLYYYYYHYYLSTTLLL
jgi:hypothetical protein